MIQGFSSKLTAYDFLGMLIPGVVVMFCVCHSCYSNCLINQIIQYCCGCKEVVEEKPTFLAEACLLITFFAASYLTGLIIQSVSTVIWRGLRNDKLALNYTFKKVQYKNDKYFNLNRLVGNNVSDTSLPVLYYMAMQVYLRQVWLILISWLIPFKKYSEIEQQYYEAYYWLASHNRLSATVVIESQINFMRNMIIPIFVMWYTFAEYKCMSYIAITLIILLFTSMIARQNKVYELIWEDYHWYKRLTYV